MESGCGIGAWNWCTELVHESGHGIRVWNRSVILPNPISFFSLLQSTVQFDHFFSRLCWRSPTCVLASGAKLLCWTSTPSTWHSLSRWHCCSYSCGLSFLTDIFIHLDFLKCFKIYFEDLQGWQKNIIFSLKFKQIYIRDPLEYYDHWKSSLPVSHLWNLGSLKLLNMTKLTLIWVTSLIFLT